MNIRKLQRAIRRSQIVYLKYLESKTYLAAKRIYSANIEVYDLLKDYLYEVEDDLFEATVEYMSHMEDWFLQFNEEEKQITNISNLFAFERVNGGISYPTQYITKILAL